MNIDLPLLIEPVELNALLGHEKLRVIELSSEAFFHQHHIPDAKFLDYQQIITNQGPIKGLLPDPVKFSELLGQLCISPDSHVVAADNDGNLRASRFLWTLLCFGHKSISLLNGGANAWLYSGMPTATGFKLNTAIEDYPLPAVNTDFIAAKQEVITALEQPQKYAIIDARSPAEYSGQDVRSQFGGHIPGAINIDWRSTVENANNRRLKSEQQLSDLLGEHGITPDLTIIVYCHTHRRSAHTFMMLKSLGFPKVKGYAGAWSDWGNDPATPKEI